MKVFLLILFGIIGGLNAAPIAEVEIGGQGWFSTFGIASNSIKVDQISDPEVQGVKCFFTYVDKAMVWENDSHKASIACRKVVSGNVTIKSRSVLKTNKNIFSQAKGWFWKDTRVARIWDEPNQTLHYLIYTVSNKESHSGHSLSSVVIGNSINVLDKPPNR